MPRVKRGAAATKKRKRVLKQTKGYRWGRKSKERAAKEALLHAYSHSFSDRKKKKRVMRSLSQVKVNAGARENGTTYSALMNALKKKGIILNRKTLADLALNEPAVFKQLVSEAAAK